MNNEQNNILAGLNSNIQPMPVNNNTSPNLVNTVSGGNNKIATEEIPGSNLTPIINVGPVDNNQNSNMITSQPEVVANEKSNVIINPMPIPGMPETNNVTSAPAPKQVNNNPNIINSAPIATNLINNNPINTPELNNSNLINQPQAQPTPQAEIKLETTTPFDIGINSMNSNNIQNSPLVESPKNIPSPVEETKTLPPEPINNNPPLTASTPNHNMNSSNNDTVSVGNYLGHILLFSIPLIGFIMLLVKAFGSKNNKNISNLAKAYLLSSIIIVVIYIVIMVALTFVIGSVADDASNYINNQWSSMETEEDYNY